MPEIPCIPVMFYNSCLTYVQKHIDLHVKFPFVGPKMGMCCQTLLKFLGMDLMKVYSLVIKLFNLS